MHSILIVDDEPLIQQSITTMLERHYPGKFQIQLASNGQEAVSITAGQHVELVLADIKMPVMDGLSMLEAFQRLRLPCEVIFISGFDDYAYVRQAMKRGAVDYLLKPIDEDEFYGLIDSFLKRGNLRVPTAFTGNVPLEDPFVQQYILDKLFCLQGDVSDDDLQKLHMNAEMPVILFGRSVQSEKNDAEEFASLRTLLVSFLSGEERIFQGHVGKVCVTLIVFSDSIHVRQYESALPVVDNWVIFQKASISDLPRLLTECQSQLNQTFFDLDGEDGPERYPYVGLTSKLVEAISRLQIERYHKLLGLILRRVCAQIPSVDSIKRLLCSTIYSILEGNPSFLSVFSQMELTDNDIILSIQNAESISQLYDNMTRIIDLQIQHIREGVSTTEEIYIAQACEYIQRHFAESFSLNDLANHLNLHPNYVSTLFKKVRGISFSQYRKQLRINEACRQIRLTNEKIYLIGMNVGYPDPVNFSRSFKDITGYTPSEYRTLFGKDQGDALRDIER